MFREEEFARWSAAYLDSISDTWRHTCPSRWGHEAADYDMEQDRAAFRRMKLLRDIHDWTPLPSLDPANRAALDLALQRAEVRQVAGHLELTPTGFRLLTGHTIDRYLLMDWRL